MAIAGTTTAHHDALAALDALMEGMPPVAAMRIHTRGFEGGRLHLDAPLAANVNDKGCAFGGSLVSLMTLAGWGRVVLGLREAGIEAEVYVADSQVRYLAPLYADLNASAGLAVGEDWPAVLHCFREKGRARVQVEAVVADAEGRSVATLSGRYAILRAAG